ncbi:hypothetical protein CC80DRAFT_512927 [Byssothecium circinans]|uniref:Nucleotide-diphospho-sugar transferase domain-containing protein n=1 Tax=Byssothecium circinans TaxID=147558 RepID=A0A6A5UAE5_9PLEO|nr:hypothetical protein CC80DRAFT_512927 [Byssothecium circinans]
MLPPSPRILSIFVVFFIVAFIVLHSYSDDVKDRMHRLAFTPNAIFDHYLWSCIHNYDYKFFQALPKPGYHDTWILPSRLRSLLSTNQYDFIVVLDADVSITHPDVPLEFLLNKWGVSRRTNIALPWDVQEVARDGSNKTISVDGKGIQVLNTGVVVVQNLEFTRGMLDAWVACPGEETYEGCARWKVEWSHEQRAFSEFIRYDFNPEGDNIVAIPCDDAMSFPGMAAMYPGRIASDCNGHFFRHHTLNKEKTKGSVATSVMQLMYSMMQNSLRGNIDKIAIVEGTEGAGASG